MNGLQSLAATLANLAFTFAQMDPRRRRRRTCAPRSVYFRARVNVVHQNNVAACNNVIMSALYLTLSLSLSFSLFALYKPHVIINYDTWVVL